MKIISVFIGSPYNVLSKRTLPRLIEEKFGSKLSRISKYHYNLKTQRDLIQFYTCYKSRRDKSYYISREYFKKEKKEDVPPPTREIIKGIGNVDKVFVFGTCGALKDGRNSIFVPDKFYEIFFKDLISVKDIQEIKLKKPISCKNLFSEVINGRKGGVLTSNLTLISENIESGSKKDLSLLARKLSSKVNCVDMECYSIVKRFYRKPIGVFLYSSDVIGKDTEMNFDLKRFQRIMCDSLYKGIMQSK